MLYKWAPFMQNYGSEECPVTQLSLSTWVPVHTHSWVPAITRQQLCLEGALNSPTSLPVLLLPSLPGIVSPDQSVDLTSNTVSFILKSCILFCTVQCFIALASSRSALCLSSHLRILCLERLPCTSWWLLSLILLPFYVLLHLSPVLCM